MREVVLWLGLLSSLCYAVTVYVFGWFFVGDVVGFALDKKL